MMMMMMCDDLMCT